MALTPHDATGNLICVLKPPSHFSVFITYERDKCELEKPHFLANNPICPSGRKYTRTYITSHSTEEANKMSRVASGITN